MIVERGPVVSVIRAPCGADNNIQRVKLSTGNFHQKLITLIRKQLKTLDFFLRWMLIM